MNYTVRVDNREVGHIYGESYFPRKYYYLKEAKETIARLRELKANPKLFDKNGKEKKI